MLVVRSSSFSLYLYFFAVGFCFFFRFSRFYFFLSNRRLVKKFTYKRHSISCMVVVVVGVLVLRCYVMISSSYLFSGCAKQIRQYVEIDSANITPCAHIKTGFECFSALLEPSLCVYTGARTATIMVLGVLQFSVRSCEPARINSFESKSINSARVPPYLALARKNLIWHTKKKTGAFIHEYMCTVGPKQFVLLNNFTQAKRKKQTKYTPLMLLEVRFDGKSYSTDINGQTDTIAI